MILPQFEVLTPKTIDEACAELARYRDEGAVVLAGGTDLLVDLRQPIIPQHVPRCDGCSSHPQGQVATTIDCGAWEADPLLHPGGSIRPTADRAPKYVVSLHRIKQLRGIEILPDGALRIGACTTITEIERHPEIRTRWTALAEGADHLGSPLVRNRGTLGGNIANARPAADTAVPTIGLGATLILRGPNAERRVPAADFPLAPGKTVRQPDEIITAVEYPAAGEHSGSAYYKLANRKVLEISTVCVSVYLALDQPGGKIKAVRVALGAVGPTPLVAASVDGILIGQHPSTDLITEAAQAARNNARPIDDHRGSAWYRLEMVEVLTRRLLTLALNRAESRP